MQEADKRNFYTAYGLMADHFGVQLSQMRLASAFELLQDISVEEIQQAIYTAVKTCEYFPAIATLRKLAGVDIEILPPAERAWLKLRNLDTRYNREALADPITHEVFEAMGGGYILEWGFGNWPLDQEERKRREFISRYREAKHARALPESQRRGELV